MAAFRRSIEQQDVRPAELRLDSADLSSIETLLTELSHEDPRRVIYAIDMPVPVESASGSMLHSKGQRG